MLILPLIAIIACGLFDGSGSSIFAGLLIYILSSLYSLKVGSGNRSKAFELNSIICFVYIIAAFVFSRSFLNGNFFMVSDSSRYIANYGRYSTFYYDWGYFKDCYLGFSDTNALYNGYMLAISVFANNYLDGTTGFYMTLAQTLFGVLSMDILYRIMLSYFEEKKAYRYTLMFATLSLFLFYSSVVLRDIVIAFFFILAIEIILQPFKSINVVKLLIFMLFTWGIRLYSGFFYCIFIALYLYLYSRNAKAKAIILPIFIVIAIAGSVVVFGASAMEQTTEEIDVYNNMTTEATASSGGFISKLYKLPPGVRHVAVMFYSQMAPFPSYTVLDAVSTPGHFFIALDVMIYEFFWFFVFYGLAICLVFKKAYKILSINELMLLGMAVIFILANTAHPDIRRMMPVYPIIYLLYNKVKDDAANVSWFKSKKQLLTFIYFGLIIVYMAIKGV